MNRAVNFRAASAIVGHVIVEDVIVENVIVENVIVEIVIARSSATAGRRGNLPATIPWDCFAIARNDCLNDFFKNPPDVFPSDKFCSTEKRFRANLSALQERQARTGDLRSHENNTRDAIDIADGAPSVPSANPRIVPAGRSLETEIETMSVILLSTLSAPVALITHSSSKLSEMNSSISRSLTCVFCVTNSRGAVTPEAPPGSPFRSVAVISRATAPAEFALKKVESPVRELVHDENSEI